MCIYQFMNRLIEELYENGFYFVDVYNQPSKDKNEFSIKVTCKKDNKKYDYDYSLNKNCIDDISIQEIVYGLLMK